MGLSSKYMQLKFLFSNIQKLLFFKIILQVMKMRPKLKNETHSRKFFEKNMHYISLYFKFCFLIHIFGLVYAQFEFVRSFTLNVYSKV